MNKLILTLVCLYMPFCTLGSTYAATKKSKLAPTLKRKIRRENSGYNQCRRDALKKLKKSKPNLAKLGPAMQICKTKYPTSAIYRDCKSKAFQLYKKSKSASKKSLKRCKKIQKILFYRSEEPVPFFRYQGKLIYAGADLKSPVKESLTTSLPNFSCDRVLDTFEGFESPEYLLFGNSPKLFGDLGTLNTKQLRKLFRGKAVTPKKKKKKKKGEDYLSVKGFGRIYDLKGDPLAFFPSVHCYFAGKLGKYFDDHKIYYLIDQKSKALHPYFGVSFYKKSQKTFKSDDIIKRVIQRLGKEYQARRLRPDYYFISKKAVKEFDAEHDPKNLCAIPRSNQLGVALRTFDQDGLQPKSLVVANIDNVCKFGDELARKLKVK